VPNLQRLPDIFTKETDMKTRLLIAMIAAMSVPAAALAADEGEAMFNKNKCSSCHKLDSKAVGPALKDIAAKYAGDKEAAAKLEKKVRAGGAGAWGTMPMPRTPASVSDGEIKAMVGWVLSHK
jgi:cytochrome c